MKVPFAFPLSEMRSRRPAGILWVITLLLFGLGAAHAQPSTGSTSVGGGTLSWSYTQGGGQCSFNQMIVWSFFSFKFTYGGTAYPLSSGSDIYISAPPVQNCPQSGPQPAVLAMSLPAFGSTCVIDFQAQSGGAGSAWETGTCNPSYSGYIEPKYLVVGIDYVVPGSRSSQQVCSSGSLSTTHTLKNTFSSSYQNDLKVSVTGGGGIFKFLNGTQSATYSTKATQTTASSNAVTLATTTQLCYSIPGPTNDYVPNNHDYDVIWLWLNPVASLTFFENANGTVTSIVFNGYGFNAADQPEMDIYPVYVGCLNGDLSCSLPNLQRTWDTADNWPTGQGPGLTSADYSAILALDPFAMCTRNTPSGHLCSVTPDPARFSPTLNQDIPYVQPPVGGQPLTTTFTLTNTTTDTQSLGYSSQNTTSFGIEKTYAFGGFLVGLSITTSTSQSYSTTYEVDNELQTSHAVSDQVSITGPACNVSGNVCNPVYPSPSAPGPTQFEVLEDNLYGTFLLYPVNWYY